MTVPMKTSEVERERLMRFAEAYDTEAAAQMGEPSPWKGLTVCADDVAWVEDRIACARAGFDAIRRAAEGEREARQ